MATSEDFSKNIQVASPHGSIVAAVVLAIWAVTLITGQLVRLPLFGHPPTGGGGILPSDIANVVVIGYALALKARVTHAKKLSLLSITPFLLWSLFVLLLHIDELPSSALLISLSYWVRLAVTLALLPAFSIIFQHKNNKSLFRPLILFLNISLVMLGALQLLLYPSLQGISGGWDPHMFRMVSTWLDPNFFGAFLAILLPYAVIAAGNSGKRRVATAIGLLFATLLTQSRSAFIAIFLAAIFCGILYLLQARIAPVIKKLLPIGISIVVVCIAFVVTLLGDRAANLFMHDPTVSIRGDAYKTVWRNLVEPNIFLGIGYNAYQFAAKDAWLIADFSAHSRAGSDSSILTLLVTTGLIGTALFLFPILTAAAFHLRRYLQTQNKYSLCFLFTTIVLLVQSQFTNSLLYPHILMVYMLVAAISFVYD